MNAKVVLTAAFGLAMVGCGGTKAPDIAAYQKLGADLSAAVESHETTCATLTTADCPGERSRYDAEVRPMLDRMLSMSGDMDACMNDMGYAASADMRGTCQSMRTELDSHLAAACTADIAGEASRHAAVMGGMLQHEMDRSVAMQGMMGGSMMSGGMCHPHS